MERSKLYKLVFDNQKRDSLKSFKWSISDMIERGQAPQWIATVTREDLVNHGQEINRLFQILVEGHGNAGGVPLVDSLTLTRASERVDLFSKKQCECLRKKGVEVDELMLKETERLVQNLREDEVSSKSRSCATSDITHEKSSNVWLCEKCTFRNEGDDTRCAACDEHKGPSFLTVAKRNNNTRKVALPTAVTRTKKAVLVKKAPASSSSTNTVWVNNKCIPELIGPRGKNQKELIAKTRAISIYAFQDRLDKDGMCPVEVQGNRDSFEKVVDILKKKFNSDTKIDTSPRVRLHDVSAKETIWIRNKDVPDMIGLQGKTIQGLKTETGVKSITAWQDRVKDDGMCPVVVRGNSEAVKKAATTIMNMFCGIPDESYYPLVTETTQNVVDSVCLDNIEHIATAAASQVKKPPTLVLNGEVAAGVIVRPLPNDTSTPSVLTATLKSALGVESSSDSSVASLSDFLQEHESCLTCPAGVFCKWLESVQITNLEDLKEALEDKEFASEEMKANGLKYFKRNALRKALEASQKSTVPTPFSSDEATRSDPPFELLCPIRHVLMTEDPVLAPDGYTYEREAIEEWLEREGDTALSPMTHEPLGDVSLVPNVLIRTMARDWYQANRTNSSS